MAQRAPDPLELIDRSQDRRRQAIGGRSADESGHLAHLATLSHLVDTYLQQRLKPHGLTPADYRVLSALRIGAAGERATPQDLNRFTRITSAGMTRTLDRLETAGYLARSPNPDDRRSVFIELTATGWEFAETVMREIDAHYAGVLEGVAAPEIKAEVEILRSVISRLAGSMAAGRSGR